MLIKVLSRGSRIIAAVIFLQTLSFKFTAHPESVAIFSAIGMEPWGRIGVGVVELLVGLLLLVGGKYHGIGAFVGLGVMLGAIYFHLSVLGIDTLFRMAVVTAILCFYVVRDQRKVLMDIYKKMRG